MRKLLNKPWFVAVLAISAVAFVALSLREQTGSRRPRARRAPAAAVAAPEPVNPSDETVADGTTVDATAVSIPAVLSALVFPANIPDPFARRETTMVAGEPEAEAGPVAPDAVDAIQLTAVWRQGGVALALINNRILRAGETIGRLTIDEIALDGIWVSHWKGRNFVAFGAAFRLMTPVAGVAAQSLALHEK